MAMFRGFWKNFKLAWKNSRMRECVRDLLTQFYNHQYPEHTQPPTKKTNEVLTPPNEDVQKQLNLEVKRVETEKDRP